jgi:hypothetical protein
MIRITASLLNLPTSVPDRDEFSSGLLRFRQWTDEGPCPLQFVALQQLLDGERVHGLNSGGSTCHASCRRVASSVHEEGCSTKRLQPRRTICVRLGSTPLKRTTDAVHEWFRRQPRHSSLTAFLFVGGTAPRLTQIAKDACQAPHCECGTRLAKGEGAMIAGRVRT